MIESIIVDLLSQNQVVAEAVGANIFPVIVLDQKAIAPYLVYYTESGPTINCDGGGGIAEPSLTIQVVAEKMIDMLILAPEVITALNRKSSGNLLHCSLADAGSDDFDEDNQYYYRNIRFNCISQF